MLTENKLKELRAAFNRRNTEPVAVIKTELREAALGIDAVMDGVKTTVNEAIPISIRSKLTTQQKFLMFFLIAQEHLEGE